MPDQRWDAGNAGCGGLIMKLAARMKDLEPGQTLELTVRDEGAGHDLPSWCRLAGHELVSADHPVYLIRKGK